MEILGLLLALLVPVGIIYAVFKTVIYTHRQLKSYFQTNSLSLFFQSALVIAGCTVGILLASLRWSWSETQDIVGFPIPVAAWEYRSGAWYDFVSPFSILLWVLDFVIWVGLVHLFVACVLRVKNRKII